MADKLQTRWTIRLDAVLAERWNRLAKLEQRQAAGEFRKTLSTTLDRWERKHQKKSR